MKDDTRHILLGGIGIVFSGMLGVNAFFVRRLVEQIDETQRNVRLLQDDVIRVKERLGITARDGSYGPRQISVKFHRGDS